MVVGEKGGRFVTYVLFKLRIDWKIPPESERSQSIDNREEE